MMSLFLYFHFKDALTYSMKSYLKPIFHQLESGLQNELMVQVYKKKIVKGCLESILMLQCLECKIQGLIHVSIFVL